MSFFDDLMEAISGEDARASYMHEDGDVESLPEGITAETVEHYGGEDQGSEYYAVYKFVRGDEICYVRFEGFYASFHGADYEDCFEVAPQPVTRTEYLRK